MDQLYHTHCFEEVKIMLYCVLGNCALLAVMIGALALYLRDGKD